MNDSNTIIFALLNNYLTLALISYECTEYFSERQALQ